MARVVNSGGMTVELTSEEVEDLKRILRWQLDDGPVELDPVARDIFGALTGEY